MREATMNSELRTALRRQGIWGARGERLIQEWTNHVREDADQRVAEGADPDAAQEAAWKALGGPNILALKTASEFARASWLGRHPWLAGLVLPVLAWIAAFAATLFIPSAILAWIFGEPSQVHESKFLDAVFACYLLAINWLPWLLSMAWLAWIARRMPGGWKLFWITTVVLTLCSTSIGRWVTAGPWGPPVPLPFPSGILGLIAIAIAHVMGSPAAGFWASHIHIGPWIQTAILMLGAVTLYCKATAPSRATGEALSS
jgi:hypothetical protein